MKEKEYQSEISELCKLPYQEFLNTCKQLFIIDPYEVFQDLAMEKLELEQGFFTHEDSLEDEEERGLKYSINQSEDLRCWMNIIQCLAELFKESAAYEISRNIYIYPFSFLKSHIVNTSKDFKLSGSAFHIAYLLNKSEDPEIIFSCLSYFKVVSSKLSESPAKKFSQSPLSVFGYTGEKLYVSDIAKEIIKNLENNF